MGVRQISDPRTMTARPSSLSGNWPSESPRLVRTGVTRTAFVLTITGIRYLSPTATRLAVLLSSHRTTNDTVHWWPVQFTRPSLGLRYAELEQSLATQIER